MTSYAETVTRTARRVRIGNINDTNTVPLMEELGNQVLAAATAAGIDHRTAARDWTDEINAPAPDDQQRADAERTAAKTREIIAAVFKHAQENYERGWDNIVEGWTDEEIAQELHKHNLSTTEAALRHFAEIVDIITDARADRMPVPGWDY